MSQARYSHFQRREVLIVLLFACFCPTCNRAKPSEPDPMAASAPAATASAPVVAAPAASVPAPQLHPACAGKYQGQYTVTNVKSDLAQKDGAPERWISDNGQSLAGNGELTLEVNSQNIITGRASGALGQQSLRGSCDENTLRAQLDATGDSVEQIQNAFLIANLTDNQAQGTLTAATGNGLIRRSGAVSLLKAQ